MTEEPQSATALPEIRPDVLARPGYEPNEQRARVRERVREFEERIQKEWSGKVPVPERSKHRSTLDDLMKHRTLNAFRFRWFSNATAFPVLAIIVAMSGLYVLGAGLPWLSVNEVQLVAENFDVWLILLSFVLLIFGIIIFVLLSSRLDKETDDYSAAIGRLGPEIDVLITNQLNEESSVVSENAAKIRAVVSRKEDMNQVSEGVKDTMRSWRRLERLPYYLRHAWDMYYVGVDNNRRLPKYCYVRFFKFLFPFLIIIISSAWALYDAAAVLFPLRLEPALTFAGLPISQLLLISLLTIFYVSFVVYRYVQRQEKFGLELATCAAMAVFLGAMSLWLVAGDEASVRAMHLMSYTACLIVAAVINGLVFAVLADRRFKKTARIAPVQIVDALKTHKKDDVMKMFRFKGVEEYLSLLNRTRKPGAVWGGWTPEYEASLRSQLQEDGHDKYEAEVRVAIDPVVYVGERGNRRIQVCQFDPTPAFLNAIPELRTAGG